MGPRRAAAAGRVRRRARDECVPRSSRPSRSRAMQVVVHRARRGEADGIRDLAHRRRIAALLDGARDAVEDPLPSLRVMPGHDFPPHREMRCQLRTGQPSRTHVLMSNRCDALLCYHSDPTSTGRSPCVNLSSSSRYLRMARLVLKLPTYARMVWGILRDPRTPIGLKGMLAAALAYVVLPVDLDPRRDPDPRPGRRPDRPAARPRPVHPERAGRGSRRAHRARQERNRRPRPRPRPACAG